MSYDEPNLNVHPPLRLLVGSGSCGAKNRSLGNWLAVLLTSCCSWQLAATAVAEDLDPPARAARLIKLRLPIQGDDDRLYQAVLQRAVDHMIAEPMIAEPGANPARPLLVLELAVPAGDQADGRGSGFAETMKLSRFLQSDVMRGVKTIAYLPRTVKGHAVLVALACDEIAIAPEAELGEAGIDEAPDRPVEPGIVSIYQQIATTGGAVPAAVAASLVDARLEVMRVETEDRIQYVPRDEVAAIGATRTLVKQDQLTPAGSMALFTGRQARELGFARYLATNVDVLARSLQVPVRSLEEDQSLLADWRPVVIDLAGPITSRAARRVSTLIGSEIDSAGVNWIGLRIDSPGGDLESCVQLAQALAELARQEVQTVAYVPAEATGVAALVALSCDRLVMQPGAHVGGSLVNAAAANRPAGGQRLPPPDADPPPANEQADANLPQQVQREEIDNAVASIRASLDGVTEQPWSLLAAMIDPEIQVYRYSNRETGQIRLFSQEQADEQPDANLWRRGEQITTPGEPLRLDAEQAAKLGVAWQVVEKFDDLKRLYGFVDQVRVAQPSWADELVEILASDQIAILLLMVGFVGVYIELNAPGIGAGGFIATVAFVLFFWSKFTAQTADWLEVMLFITGVVFILIEVMVLPGFGLFGLGGVGLVITSLVLASQTFLLPKTESQLAELRMSIGVVVASMVAFLVAALVLRRYLPHSPLMRGMLLQPPEGADLIELDHRESIADFSHLIGRTGQATTDLLPSGRIEIDGELVDVLAEHGAIDRGDRVTVVDAQGSRVVVRKVY